MIKKYILLSFLLWNFSGYLFAQKMPSISEKTQGMSKKSGFFTFYLDEKEGKIWLEIDKMDSESLTITNFTKGKLPRLPFAQMKDEVMGKNYELSLVFAGEQRSKKLNIKYRDKHRSANVLSFPLDKKTGEIFITPVRAKREAKSFNRKFDNFIAFLFIHGLCHLKGMDHGSTMEKAEEKIRAQFGV
jgi:rRNA maturation RNase YbeY